MPVHFWWPVGSWPAESSARSCKRSARRGGAIWPRPFRRSEPLLHQGNFVIVDFQFTNEGNESKTLTQQALQLEDYSGRTSAPDPADFRYIPKDRNIFLEQVNLGVTQQGQVIFTIAPDASGLTLILKDTNLFRSSQNQARVDLGI